MTSDGEKEYSHENLSCLNQYTIVKARMFYVRTCRPLWFLFLPNGLKQEKINNPLLFSLFINELAQDIIQSGKNGVLHPNLV